MLRVSLLGEQVIDDDVTGEILSRSTRTLALVGYLAIHSGTPQSRQIIAGTFWPESGDAQALTNLRRELHHLRRLLGETGCLEVSSTDLCWRDSGSCRVDVTVLRTRHAHAVSEKAAGHASAAARSAAQGIAAYGGDFLPAVYDDWAVAARDRLRRECVELCDLLADLGTGQGDLDLAVQAARRRVALEPLEEVGYRTLMRLQMEAGDRGGAISTYHHCASVLERELGVAPGAETHRALERLIGRTASAEGRRPPRAELRRSGAGAVPLVGRAAPLHALTAHWESALRDELARVVVVRGEAGVGKSRLVTELAEGVRAEQGSVAVAQCFDISGGSVLAPVVDWLRTPELRAAAGRLDLVWRREVERLVPGVTDRADGTDVPVVGRPLGTGDRAKVDAWRRNRFFEGLAQAFLEVRRPLLLVLDNAQWCDEETFSWMSFLLRLAPRHRLMMVLTLRDGEGSAESATLDWLARVRTGHLVDELTLGPLDREETATLSRAVTGRTLPEAESSLLYATTGGFPLYVVEATRAAPDVDFADGASERLGAVLRRRIGQTSANARDTAGLAAALGRDFTLDVLTEASDLDADAVARSVDELWRRRIVRELGSGYDFSHDLLRDAAYEAVSPPRRWLLHRRLAQALELSSAERRDDVAALLAEQYDKGGRPDRAREYYGRAAEVAASRFAAAEAIRLHRKALGIVMTQPPGRQRDRRELECMLAMAAPLNASQGYASLELRAVLERAVRLAESIGSSQMLVSSLLGLWASRFVQGDIIDSLRLSARAIAVSEIDDVLLGEAHFAFAGSSVTLGRPDEAVEHFDFAHDRCRGAESLIVGTMPEVHALAWAAHAHWLLGQPETAAQRAAEAIARARSSAHPYSLAVALAYAAITYQLLDSADALAPAIRELAELCERYGFAYYVEWGLVLDGWLRGGQDGIASMRRGIENLRSQMSLARMPYWLTLLADGMAREGMTREAVATLDAAHTSASSRGDAWWLPEIERMRAAYASADHRERLLVSAVERAERQGSTVLAARCRRDLESVVGSRSTPFDAGLPNANAERTLRS